MRIEPRPGHQWRVSVVRTVNGTVLHESWTAHTRSATLHAGGVGHVRLYDTGGALVMNRVFWPCHSIDSTEVPVDG